MMLDHHYVRPERWIRRQKGPAVWDTCVLLLRLEYKVSHKSSCLNAQSQMVVPFWEVRETLGGRVSWEEVGSFGACGRAVFFPFSLPVPCSASSRNEVEKLLCRCSRYQDAPPKCLRPPDHWTEPCEWEQQLTLLFDKQCVIVKAFSVTSLTPACPMKETNIIGQNAVSHPYFPQFQSSQPLESAW